MLRLPVKTTYITASSEFSEYTSSLYMIAVCAKILNQTDLYNQAVSIHDKLVREYNERTAPPKRGFWGMFLDNITFRNMDHHIAVHYFCIEGNQTFNSTVESLRKELSPDLVRTRLYEYLENHNRKYG